MITKGAKTFVSTPVVGLITWWVSTHMGYTIPAEDQAAIGIAVMGLHTYVMRALSTGKPFEGLRQWLRGKRTTEADIEAAVDRSVRRLLPVIVRAIVYQLRSKNGQS